jgi:ABC-type multidrug transport system ATPase subunit
LLDEPTSGLNPGLDKSIMEQVRDLAHDGRAVIVITDPVDPEVLRNLGQRGGVQHGHAVIGDELPGLLIDHQRDQGVRRLEVSATASLGARNSFRSHSSARWRSSRSVGRSMPASAVAD